MQGEQREAIVPIYRHFSANIAMLHKSKATPAAKLRRILLRALPGDSDLEAFCLDYFPSVHQRFSLGMERQTKLNLLLQHAPNEELAATLARCAPTEFSQEHDDSAVEVVLTQSPKRGASVHLIIFLSGTLIFIALALGLGWASISRGPAPIPSADPHADPSSGTASRAPLAARPVTAEKSVPLMQTASSSVEPPTTKSARPTPKILPDASGKPVRVKRNETAHDPLPRESYVPPPLEQ